MSVRNGCQTVRSGAVVVAAMAGIMVLAACADLSAVREFAKSSGQLAALPVLVDDYVEAPLRQKRYEPAAQHPTLDKIHEERQTQRPGLLALQQGLTEYMDALGRLADDKLTRSNESWSTWEAATKKLPDQMVSEAETVAYAKLATVVTNIVLERYRRAKLASVIAEANGPLQVVVGALRVIVLRDFEDVRRREQEVVQDYFDTAAQLGRNDGVAELAAELGQVRIGTIAARQKALQAYANALQRIGEAHQKLYDSRDRIDQDELLAFLEQTSKDVNAARSAIDALISGQ